MYNGILIVGLISLLVGCGGGGGSSSTASDDRGEDVVDPYLGVWERSCVAIEPYDAVGVSTYLEDLFQTGLGDSTQLFLKEALTIGPESMSLSLKLFSDDQCVESDPVFDLISQAIGLDNVGGEIQVRDEWVSKNGYGFFRYSIPVNFIPADNFPIGLYHAGERLYLVEPFEAHPLGAVEEDYVVNFNKYYVRVQD